MGKRVFLIFVLTVALAIAGALTFIQSRTFAKILKAAYHKYTPFDFGVEGSFSELEIKFLPPGIILRDPSLTLKKKNPVGLPEGTKVEAKFIEVTFQVFQALTGSVNINAVAVHGASLKLDLDEKFFESAAPVPSRKKISLSWESLVHFHFRSVSLVDSDLDLTLRKRDVKKLHLRTHAKEVTIGRSTILLIPTYDLAADIEQTLLEFGAYKQKIAQLQVSSELSADGLRVHSLGFQDGGVNLHVNGAIHGNILDPSVLRSDLQFIVKGPLKEWISPQHLGGYLKVPKELGAMSGMVTVEGHAEGDLMNPVGTASAKAKLNVEKFQYQGWDVERATVDARWERPVLSVDSAQVQLSDGSIKASNIAFDVFADERIFKPKVVLENVDLRKVLGPYIRYVYPLHLYATGTADAEVSLSKDLDFEATGKTELKVTGCSFDNQKPGVTRPLKKLFDLPPVGVAGNFSVDSTGVHFEKVKGGLQYTQLELNGGVGVNGYEMDMKGPIDLAEIHELAGQEIRGKGDLHWTITGKVPDVMFTFDANVKDGKFLNLDLGDVNGKVIWDDNHDRLLLEDLAGKQGRSGFVANGYIDLGDVEALNVNVQVNDGTIPDLAKVFDWFLKRGVPWYPYDLTGSISGPIRITGKPDVGKFSALGDFSLANVDLKHELFRAVTLRAGYDNGAFVARNMAIRKKVGWLKGDVVYGTDDILHFDVHSEGMSTADIDRFSIWEIPYRAPVTLQAKGEGKLGALQGSFLAGLGAGTVGGISVPPSEVSLSLEQERMQGHLSVLGGAASAKLSWGWAKGSSSSFDAEASHLDISPFVVAINPDLEESGGLRSDLTGEAHLKFKTGDMSHLSGSSDVSAFRLSGEDYALALQKPFHVDVANGEYHFPEAVLAGNNASLSIRGECKNQRVQYNAAGTVDLGVLSFLVPEIATLSGTGKVDAQMFGAADAPNFRGSFVVKDADLRIRSIDQPIENLRFDVDWRDALMKFNNVGARFAGGLVSGEGTVEWYLTKAPDIDFRFQVDNSKIKVYPVTYAKTSGRATVKGTAFPYNVKGSFQVSEALIRENFGGSDSSRGVRSSVFMPQTGPGGSVEAQVLDLDLDVSADKAVFVQNDLFDAELRGDLKILRSPKSPRLLGNVSVIHGKLTFRDNVFVIQNGSILFDNPAVVDPVVSASAQAEVRGYKILLVTSGRLSEKKISLTSQPPLSQSDIVNLLAFGVTSSSYQNLAKDTQSAYENSELFSLLFNQSGINKGIKETLGVNQLNVRLDQAQTTSQSALVSKLPGEGTETASPKVVVQYEVTKNLRASAGSTVGVGTNKVVSAGLEATPPDSAPAWMKRFSIQGVYEDFRGPVPWTQSNSVGGDLKFRKTFK